MTAYVVSWIVARQRNAAETGDSRAPKICASCGRSFDWRRKWADNWEEIRYCSSACRRSKPGAVDRQLEAAIVELLASRARDATICPSEAARSVTPDGWRGLMERARCAARRLSAEGRVVIKQKGRVVDPSTAKGPIRLGRGPRWS